MDAIVILPMRGDLSDVALRDFDLLVAAVVLWRLASRRAAVSAEPRR
jgi:hypothetical protein